MSGAGFVLAINFVVAGLLSAAFMAIGVYNAKLTASRWFALAYAMGMAYFAFLFLQHFVDLRMPGAIISYAVILAGMAIFNVGLAQKYSVPAPVKLMAVLFAMALVVCGATEYMPRDSNWRMLAYQTPYFFMQMIGVAILRSSRVRTILETILTVTLTASALQFLSKAVLMHLSGGTGATEQDYLLTEYALISQAMTTVFAVAVALLMLVVMVRDLMAVVTAESETDKLSGILNRGGFERHARLAIERCSRGGVPVSLIIADLDHFKAVNDSFGHASGDMVIKAFAGFVKSAAGSHQLAARLGGEEFAIILPGANLVAARLFAEGARSEFSSVPIAGLPAERRFTASFGVAELAASEGLSELMRRADEALYLAKKHGRDCVRVSTPANATLRRAV
jgi:diguanylate cyclase (GGDEF)-like protein